jgi:hypothetical protein
MMQRVGWTAMVTILEFLVSGPALAGTAGREVRHSGRIVDVSPDHSAIGLEEVTAWTGPGTGVVRRSIRLTPRTSIQLIERTDHWDNTPMPGWDARPMPASQLRTGDFVTVTTDDDQRGTAVALQVIRSASSERNGG